MESQTSSDQTSAETIPEPSACFEEASGTGDEPSVGTGAEVVRLRAREQALVREVETLKTRETEGAAVPQGGLEGRRSNTLIGSTKQKGFRNIWASCR